MVHVCDREFVPEFLEDERQANGICPARYARQDAVVRSEHMVFVDGLSNFYCKVRQHVENAAGSTPTVAPAHRVDYVSIFNPRRTNRDQIPNHPYLRL